MASYLNERAVRIRLTSEQGRFRSQAEMARAIGVSRSHLNKIMHGEKDAAGKVSSWLGLTVHTLYRRKK